MEKLLVENFGPIKKVDLQLKKTMVLIGPQSSGKSTIAKLVAIFRNYSFISRTVGFNDFLKGYNLLSYLQPDTKITYKSKNYAFSFYDSKHNIEYAKEDFAELVKNSEGFKERREQLDVVFQEDLKKTTEIAKQMEAAKSEDEIVELKNQLSKTTAALSEHVSVLNNQVKVLTKVTNFSKFAVYIPSERSLFSIFSQSIFTLLNENLAIPGVIKNFGALIEKSISENKNIDLKFLNIKYLSESNEHWVVESKTQKKILLSEASSGLQTLIPLIIVITGYTNIEPAFTFVVEEPELNLFPKSQYDLVKFLIEKCLYKAPDQNGNDLIVTTHSPYCLSAFNNCLLAYIEGHNPKSTKDVEKVIAQKYWIDPKEFIAYELINGKAKSIIEKSTNLIDENYLDEASEIINSDFDSIFELHKLRINEG